MDGDTISVRVYRFHAAVRATVKGTIANFPSGPAETGDIAFATLRQATPDYDLISLDPRGVGSTTPLTCDATALVVPPFVPPTTEAGFTALQTGQNQTRGACTTASRQLDAASVAHDMEYLRQALRLPQLNIYRHSYGTLLAEKYLAQSGRSVRASILEGVVDPTQDRRQFVTTAAAASQQEFDKFAHWCGTDPTYALHGHDPVAALRRAQAAAPTIPGTFYGRPWTPSSVIALFEIRAMSGQLPLFATDLTRLANGENPIPDEPGDPHAAATPEPVNYTDPIVCQDFPLAVRRVQDAVGDLAAGRRAAPAVEYNTNSSQYSALCVGWPGPVPGSGRAVTSLSAHPTLLVSNTGDLATPADWARSVHQQLGAKAALITVNQTSNHASLGEPGCGQKIILDYLRTLTVPETTTRCPAPRTTN